jgi:hypothetical protein
MMRRALTIVFTITGLAVAACGTDAEGGDGQSSGSNTGTFGGAGGVGADLSGCATSRKKAERQPIDMVIGLDTSFSMDFDDKWLNVRDALKRFVSNPAYADLTIGLQFFPIRKQCSVEDYAMPAVPLLIQKEAAGPIIAALDAQRMADETPMVPLLRGLTSYLRSNAKPGRKPVLVLTTDGVPDTVCLEGDVPNTLENAVKVAGDAKNGSPSVPTFVIGVGAELTALNQIAAAGGTGQATLVDIEKDVQTALLTALDNIRLQSIPCDYDIPPGAIDAKQTNVTYTRGQQSRTLGFVGNEEGCAKASNAEGWYFDNENDPKKVFLCKTFCDAIKTDAQGTLDLVFGCPRAEVR